MAESPQPLESLLRSRRVIVCVGAGGVGKTTISAAMGVAAARMGRNTLVLTVDPARRLANALGLSSFEQHIQTIPAAAFSAQTDPSPHPLDVAMLDVKSTFDRVIERHTSSARSRDAILNNTFYRQASTALAGSQEYMAMQRLYEVVVDEPYDLVILDTPPSAHALDFLDAPRRMIELFGSSAFRRLLRGFSGGGAGSRMFASQSLLMRGLGRFTSADMFHNLLSFFAALSETFDGFVRGAEDVLALLHSERTAFVIVSAPDDGSTHEGLYLRQRLRDEHMQLGAWVLNRTRPESSKPRAVSVDLPQRLGAALADSDLTTTQVDQIATAALMMADMAAADAAHKRRLQEKMAGQPQVVTVARAEVEPASLAELSRLARVLVADSSVDAP